MVPAVASKRSVSKSAPVKYLAASKTKTKTPAKAAAAPKRPRAHNKEPIPVFVNGLLARNRHYLISLDVAEAATVRANREGWPLAEVLRLGFDQYVKGVRRRPAPEKEPLVVLSKDALNVLAVAWKSGDRSLQNATLAAFHHAGWPLRTLADALVASGAVKNMTRQGVSLRVMAAVDTDVATVKGVVSPSGPRRTLTATKKKPRVELKDVGVRVANDVYERAKIRARAEGAQMSAICEDILARYVKGSFKMPKRQVVPIRK